MTKVYASNIGFTACLIAMLFGVIAHSSSAPTEQLADTAFSGSLDHPAIQYGSRPATDLVTELNRKIANDQVRPAFNETDGYLRSILADLRIPIESQIMVFSK